MNYPLLFKLLSFTLWIIVVAMGVSAGVGMGFDEWNTEPRALAGFARAMAATGGVALLFSLLGRRAQMRLFRKEALALIGLGWLLCSGFGALPYLFILPACTPADALFESASGLTTTGASVFTGFEQWPRSLLFWRCLTQWIGGLGVVVFFVAILGSLGASGKILFSNESSGTSTDIEAGRFQSGVMQIMYVYLGLSACCMLSLHLLGMSWYDAVCHMFTTVSTGGYSTSSASIEGFNNPAIEWALILFMFLGGTSFLLMIRVLRRDMATVRRNSELPVYFLVILTATLLVLIELIDQSGELRVMEQLRQAMFQVVSIMTTTGYTSTDFDQWNVAAKIILLVLMLCGGCTGSTAGGVKILRVVVISQLAWRNVERAFRANVVRPLKVNGHTLNRDSQDQVVSFILMTVLVFVGGVIMISFLENQTTLASSISAVGATLFNVGPGFEQIGPTRNFGFLHENTKVFLSLLMVMGRLELYAVLVLFSPSLWKRFS